MSVLSYQNEKADNLSFKLREFSNSEDVVVSKISQLETIMECKCAETDKQQYKKAEIEAREIELLKKFDDRFKVELGQLKQRYEMLLSHEQARSWCAMKEADRDRKCKMAALRSQLECRHIAGLMFVICAERNKCHRLRNNMLEDFNLHVAKLERILFNRQYVLDEMYKACKKSSEVDHEWRQRMKKIIREFHKFLSYTLDTTPEGAQYLLDVDKLLDCNAIKCQEIDGEPVNEEVFDYKDYTYISNECYCPNLEEAIKSMDEDIFEKWMDPAEDPPAEASERVLFARQGWSSERVHDETIDYITKMMERKTSHSKGGVFAAKDSTELMPTSKLLKTGSQGWSSEKLHHEPIGSVMKMMGRKTSHSKGGVLAAKDSTELLSTSKLLRTGSQGWSSERIHHEPIGSVTQTMERKTSKSIAGAGVLAAKDSTELLSTSKLLLKSGSQGWSSERIHHEPIGSVTKMMERKTSKSIAGVLAAKDSTELLSTSKLLLKKNGDRSRRSSNEMTDAGNSILLSSETIKLPSNTNKKNGDRSRRSSNEMTDAGDSILLSSETIKLANMTNKKNGDRSRRSSNEMTDAGNSILLSSETIQLPNMTNKTSIVKSERSILKMHGGPHPAGMEMAHKEHQVDSDHPRLSKLTLHTDSLEVLSQKHMHFDEVKNHDPLQDLEYDKTSIGSERSILKMHGGPHSAGSHIHTIVHSAEMAHKEHQVDSDHPRMSNLALLHTDSLEVLSQKHMHYCEVKNHDPLQNLEYDKKCPAKTCVGEQRERPKHDRRVSLPPYLHHRENYYYEPCTPEQLRDLFKSAHRIEPIPKLSKDSFLEPEGHKDAATTTEEIRKLEANDTICLCHLPQEKNIPKNLNASGDRELLDYIPQSRLFDKNVEFNRFTVLGNIHDEILTESKEKTASQFPEMMMNLLEQHPSLCELMSDF